MLRSLAGACRRPRAAGALAVLLQGEWAAAEGFGWEWLGQATCSQLNVIHLRPIMRRLQMHPAWLCSSATWPTPPLPPASGTGLPRQQQQQRQQ